MRSVTLVMWLFILVLGVLLLGAPALAQAQAEAATEAPKEPPKKKQGKPPAPTTEIAWLNDLDAAMSLAEKNGRPVITYFTYDT